MFVAFWRFAQIFFSPFTTTCELNTPLPLPTLHTPEHQAAPAPLLGGCSFWGQQRVRSGGWRERAQKMLFFFFFFRRCCQRSSDHTLKGRCGAYRTGSPAEQGRQLRDPGGARGAATRPRWHRPRSLLPRNAGNGSTAELGAAKIKPWLSAKALPISWQERQRRTQAGRCCFSPGWTQNRQAARKDWQKTTRSAEVSVSFADLYWIDLEGSFSINSF